MRNGILIAGLLLILGFGLVHARWTDREHLVGELQNATGRLAKLSRTLGDWQGSDDSFDEEQRAASGAEQWVLRHYTNQHTGTKITILVVCGRPGPVSVHSPDVCYSTSGMQVEAAPDRTIELHEPLTPANFKVTHVSSGARKIASRLEVLWSLNGSGKWETPRYPRLAFATHPFLYKLYVVRPVADNDSERDDQTEAFLQLLLPALHDCMTAQ